MKQVYRFGTDVVSLEREVYERPMWAGIFPSIEPNPDYDFNSNVKQYDAGEIRAYLNGEQISVEEAKRLIDEHLAKLN